MLDEALRQVLSELAAARAEAYGLLSVGFARPDTALAAALWQGTFARRCQRALQATLAMIPGEAMQALARPGELPTCDAMAQALQLEYARLFIGPHALPAPPYESVYREPLWGVMGETTLAVRQAYEAIGFGLDPEARELPDHVAVELEFLAHLSEAQAAAWSVVDEARARRWLCHEHAFLEAHLGQWLPAFAERVVVAAAVPFYSGLARIASGFVAQVRGQLGTMVQALTATSEVKAKVSGWQTEA